MALRVPGCKAHVVPRVTYRECHRLQYHFSPQRNWMNDPCGLIHHDDDYHLFYQYNPFGDQWGHMHWGHAVSPDLVRWIHRPIAIHETQGVMAFTGCTVWDADNTSRLGTNAQPPLVALYTGFRQDDNGRKIQDQRVAFSVDNGTTWTNYKDNPVLDIGCAEFRDPDVFWLDATKEWRMAVVMATERRVSFYGSRDLLRWTHLSHFGLESMANEVPDEDGIYEWECPNFFRIAVEGGKGAEKWVLVVSTQGKSGCKRLKQTYGIRYFIGEFDGTSFSCDDTAHARWVDNACDFYAMQLWNGIPSLDGRKIWIGWFNYNEDISDLPVSPWRGSQTIPRELTLIRTRGELMLAQRPIRELLALRNGGRKFQKLTATQLAKDLRNEPATGQTLEIKANIRLLSPEASFRLSVLVNESHRTEISVRALSEFAARIALDTSKSGASRPKCPDVYSAEVDLSEDGSCDIHIFVDWSSVEIFAALGTAVFSCRVFPSETANGIEVQGTDVHVQELAIYPLQSIW